MVAIDIAKYLLHLLIPRGPTKFSWETLYLNASARTGNKGLPSLNLVGPRGISSAGDRFVSLLPL